MNRLKGSITSTIHRGKEYWSVDCNGHVRTLFKRLFPNVYQYSTSTLSITNNPENCRDLLWFVDRYPMEMTAQIKKKLKAGAEKHIDLENKILSLLSNILPPDDFELAVPAREYQKVGASVCQASGGTIIGDKVGLGKSITSMCPMTKKEYLPALVVTLTHLPSQWVKYLKRFAPKLKVHVLKTGKPYPLSTQNDDMFDNESARYPDVIISNYHKLYGWKDELAGVIKYVVFDECQELRRDESNKYVAAKEIAHAANLRMGLSATPIYNYGAEFFNVIEVINPGALGSKEEFTREWCADQLIKDPAAFGNYLRESGLLLVRTRKDVGRELPKTNIVPVPIEVDEKRFSGIQSQAVELAKLIVGEVESNQVDRFHASGQFNIMMRLQTGIVKAPYVADFVRMVLESEDKVLLFGWHHDVYAIWMHMLAEFKPVLYTGGESPKQKEAAKEAFINGDSRVMIISLRAGAGVDGLQEVTRVGIFGELDWSHGVHIQCVGRYDREPESGILDELGPAFAYFLYADYGSDPIVADVVGIKKQQIEGVIETDVELIEEIQIDPNHIRLMAQDYLERQLKQ